MYRGAGMPCAKWSDRACAKTVSFGSGGSCASAPSCTQCPVWLAVRLSSRCLRGRASYDTMLPRWTQGSGSGLRTWAVQ